MNCRGRKLLCGLVTETEDKQLVAYEKKISLRDLIWMNYSIPYLPYEYMRYDIPAVIKGIRPPYECVEKNISVDQDFYIIGGVSLLSEVIKEKQEYVNVKVAVLSKKDQLLYKRRDTLYKQDYSISEQEIIEQSFDLLREYMRYPFIILLWPAACEIWDDITQRLKQICSEKIQFIDSEDKIFSSQELDAFVKVAYHTTNNPAVLWKADVLKSGMPKECVTFPVRIIRCSLDNPLMVYDKEEEKPVSSLLLSIKQGLRNYYKNKVANYQFDNIIHAADNFTESDLIWRVWKTSNDLSSFYSKIASETYPIAIIKRCREYNPDPNNPILRNKFLYNSEIDLLVLNSDIDRATETIFLYCKHHFENSGFNVEIETRSSFNHGEKFNRFINVKYDDFLVLVFHVQSRLYALKQSFLKEALMRVRNDGVQPVIDEPCYEIYMRIAEVIEHPQKSHHVEYIKHYRSLIDFNKIPEIFEQDTVEKVYKIIQSL